MIDLSKDRIEELAKTLDGHVLATGNEGIPGDGEYAWLRCTCGYTENVETPGDDITVAEKVWNGHLAEALVPVIKSWLEEADAEVPMHRGTPTHPNTMIGKR